MIRDLIVNLGLDTRDPAADFAVSVAETFGAHALGVAFAYDPVVPGSAMGGIPSQYIETQRAEAEKKASDVISRFTEAAKRAGIPFDTRVLNASLSGAADQLGRLARRFDLAVVGQPRRDSAGPEIVDEGVLFGSGRPVVFVPYVQKAPLKLDRVMLCWDGSRTAARAVADSLPFLQKTGAVEIVIVSDRPPADDEMAGADLGQHLARHGLKVDVKRLTAPDIEVSETILSYAADSDADMIVMGGYGHSRLREFVLGGVTRGMLQSMTVPVLMSH